MTAPSVPTVPAVFDVCGPLPEGTTVLEASAGTGKTFTIAALATRYVAEGVATLAELMLVTFGRAATSELRDRVRERLVTAERALRDPSAAASTDALVRHLADTDDAEHLLAFGAQLSFDELNAEVPREDEQGRGWHQSEASRFGRYALRLWAPVLAAEECRDL